VDGDAAAPEAERHAVDEHTPGVGALPSLKGPNELAHLFEKPVHSHPLTRTPGGGRGGVGLGDVGVGGAAPHVPPLMVVPP